MRIAASLLKPGAVRAEDHVLEREQRMVLGRRLLVEHVQAGAGDFPRGQGVVQRRLVDDAAARDVDDAVRRR